MYNVNNPAWLEEKMNKKGRNLLSNFICPRCGDIGRLKEVWLRFWRKWNKKTIYKGKQSFKHKNQSF